MRILPTSFIHICISHSTNIHRRKFFILTGSLRLDPDTSIALTHYSYTSRTFSHRIYTHGFILFIFARSKYSSLFFSAHFTVILYFYCLFTSRGYSQITFFYSNAIHICRLISLFHTVGIFIYDHDSLIFNIYSYTKLFHSHDGSVHIPVALFVSIGFSFILIICTYTNRTYFTST